MLKYLFIMHMNLHDVIFSTKPIKTVSVLRSKKIIEIALKFSIPGLDKLTPADSMTILIIKNVLTHIQYSISDVLMTI